MKYLAKNIFHRFWCSNSIKKELPYNTIPRNQKEHYNKHLVNIKIS
jgi:hypothetical protein